MSPKKRPKDLLDALRDTVGADGVLDAEEDMLVFEFDASIDKARPQAVVFPSTAEQVSQVVRLANAHEVPLVPRGAGTGLSGGALAVRGGILLSTTRMDRVLEVDPVNQTAVVEPGLVNLKLTQQVAEHGLHYVPDPSSQKTCTIGGNVAENSGGPHCLAYGVTTNHVVGMEVVLPDGEIMWVGGQMPDRPGYDLAGIFVGSEGTVGIATKVKVRLVRDPEAILTMVAVFDQMDQATGAVSAIIGNGLVPAALEMIDQLSIEAVAPTLPEGFIPSDAEAVLLVEVEGLREQVAADLDAVKAVCYELGARETRDASSPEEREQPVEGPQGGLWGPRTYRAQLLHPRRGCAPDAPSRGAAQGERDLRPSRLPGSQCVPRRRREPSPLYRLQRAGPRREPPSPGGGSRGDASLHRRGGLYHWRTRRRGGEAGVHAPHLLR